MKHALIASILTVLMTLPATAQQRRLSGPARPAAGTPGKLEVPTKLQPAFRNAIEAQKAVIRAQIAAFKALKKLNLEMDGFIKAGGDKEDIAPSNVAFPPKLDHLVEARKAGNESAARGPQKEKLTEINPYALQGGTPKKEKLSESNPYGLQSSQQTEEAFFKLVALLVKSVGMADGHVRFNVPKASLLGDGSVRFNSQRVNKELDGAIGDLNTQLNLLPALAK